MKKTLSLIAICMLLLMSFLTVGFGDKTLDEALKENNNQQVTTENVESTDANKEDTYTKNKGFIDGIRNAGDVSADVEGVAGVTSGLKTAVSFIVQVIAYAITILLALRVVLDLMFISIPFTRTFLGNGYIGNAQAGAGGMPGSMNQGMMGGMGGMGGRYGGSRYGGGMMGGGMMGGGMMGGGMTPGAQQGMGLGGGPDQQPGATGRIQWISNAALNAIAGENTVGPDGKAVSPFKLYVKDMAVVLIIVPILITLAVTGALTNLGFIIGQVVVDGISKIGNMM